MAKIKVDPCAAEITFRGLTWRCSGKILDDKVHDGYHWWEEKGQFGVLAWPKVLAAPTPPGEGGERMRIGEGRDTG